MKQVLSFGIIFIGLLCLSIHQPALANDHGGGHGEEKKEEKKEEGHGGGHGEEKKEEKKEEGHGGGHGESKKAEVKVPYVPIRLPPSRKKVDVENQDVKDLRLYDGLVKRKIELEDYERAVNTQKDSLLKEIEKLKEENIKLQKIKADIADLLKEKAKLDRKKLEEMKTVYEKMEPKNVAAIFEKADIDLSVVMLQMMNPSKSSRIIEKLTPEKAVKISELYTSFTKEGRAGVINSICEKYFQGYDGKEGTKPEAGQDGTAKSQ